MTESAPPPNPIRRRFKAAIIAGVVSLGLLASACGGSTTGAGTGATSVPTASQEKVSVAFIGESSSSDAVWSVAVAEMREEANTMGVEFVDRFADGDYAVQAKMIDEEVARGVDAIIAPFFDPKAANQAIERAQAAGVKIYALLGVPDVPADELSKIGVTAASWTEYGQALAKITLPQVQPGAKIVWPAEVPGASYITDSVAGFKAYAEEQKISVSIEVLDAGSDPTTSAARQLSYLTANPDTAAVVTTGSIAIGAAVTAMRQGNLSAGKPVLAGFITNPQGYQGVKEGYMMTGIWPGIDDNARQALEDVVDMVTKDIAPPKRVQSYVLVDKANLDETVPEAIRQ